MAEINKVNNYKTVYRGGTAEIVEKKSRFIAHSAHVESEEEALAFIEQIKKQYWDARHNCHAFSVGVPNETARCSDDGEPAQTAGKPMLDVLMGQQLKNTVVVVTRYFGGILLGTGGLVRAYSAAVQEGKSYNREVSLPQGADEHGLYNAGQDAVSGGQTESDDS